MLVTYNSYVKYYIKLTVIGPNVYSDNLGYVHKSFSLEFEKIVKVDHLEG